MRVALALLLLLGVIAVAPAQLGQIPRHVKPHPGGGASCSTTALTTVLCLTTGMVQ